MINNEYKWSNAYQEKCYVNGNNYRLWENLNLNSNLNDEVEIIEEPKKIEKLDLDGYYDDNSYCECKSEWCSSEDVLVVKINELIDEINNLKEKKEEQED